MDTCPDCGKRVLYAVSATGLVLGFDPDEAGEFAAWQDTGAARWRRAEPSEQLALGEYLFRRHDVGCAGASTLTDLAAERALRRPAVREEPRERRAVGAR